MSAHMPISAHIHEYLSVSMSVCVCVNMYLRAHVGNS